MLSDKKLLANRQNARKSTGPRTPEGKRVSSQNAVAHGLLAREALLPGEDAGELDALRAELTADLAPVGALEVMWVDTIVTTSWKLRRSNRVEAGIFEYQQNQSCQSEPLRQFTPREKLALIFMSYEDCFEKVARHEARLHRQRVQACHELERAQAARRGVSVPLPAALDVIVSTTEITQPDLAETACVTEVQTVDTKVQTVPVDPEVQIVDTKVQTVPVDPEVQIVDTKVQTVPVDPEVQTVDTEVQTIPVDPEVQIVDPAAPTGDAAPEALPVQTFPEAPETETETGTEMEMEITETETTGTD
jgi:hypothetical protein